MKLYLTFFAISISFNLIGQNIKSVKSERFDFEIEIPDGWRLREDERDVSVNGPIPDNIGISFVEKTTETLDQASDRYINDVKGLSSFKTIREGLEEINGNKYRWIEYEMRNMGIMFHSYLYLTVHKGTLYSVNLTSKKGRDEMYMDILLKILRTIKIR